MSRRTRIVVGISGASGAAYARRTVQMLARLGVETHVVVSPLGQRLLHDELGLEHADPDALAGPGVDASLIHRHNYRDVGATIASGSFMHEGMVIVPCSSNTLASVALGIQQNLLHRAAAVTLKERRRLVLVHREMPLSLADIRNMEQATLAGAVVCPASPGFYLLPQRVEELVDFVVGRVLDLLRVEHDLPTRWEAMLKPPSGPGEPEARGESGPRDSMPTEAAPD